MRGGCSLWFRNELGIFSVGLGQSKGEYPLVSWSKDGESVKMPYDAFMRELHDIRFLGKLTESCEPLAVRTIADNRDPSGRNPISRPEPKLAVLARLFEKKMKEDQAETQRVGASTTYFLWDLMNRPFDPTHIYRVETAVLCSAVLGPRSEGPLPVLLVSCDHAGQRLGLMYELSWNGVPLDENPLPYGDMKLDFAKIDLHHMAECLGIPPDECRLLASNRHNGTAYEMPKWDMLGDDLKKRIYSAVRKLGKELEIGCCAMDRKDDEPTDFIGPSL